MARQSDKPILRSGVKNSGALAKSLERRGFALVSTVSVLALLSLIVIGLLSMSSVTVRSVGQEDAVRMNRIRVDGLIDAGEWARADSVGVLLPDGREITILRQRGPDSLDFAFLGLGGNWSRDIHPEILLDVSGAFPAQFSRDSWWFRLSPAPCVKRGSVEGDCSLQQIGLERSAPPADRRDNLEVRITLSALEFSPTTTPEIALSA